jgi:hypothetical protein
LSSTRETRQTGLGLGLAFLVFYAATGSTTVQGGDAGELLAVMAAGGVAHPPGYPLFTRLGALLVQVPVGTVPWRGAMTAGLLTAAGLGLLGAALHRVTGHRLAAIAAVGSLGLSGLCWRYATVSEVFAGGVFTAGAVVWVAARVHDGWRGPVAAGALGLAVASGIANHHTVVLLAPIVLWALWHACRERPVPSLAAGAAGLVPGFAAYLALMGDAGVWRWGDTGTWDGLVYHFLRRDYGTFSLALSDADVPVWAHPWDWLQGLPGQYAGVFFLLGLLGVVDGVRRQRGFALALLATLLLTGPLFFLRLNLPAEGFWTVVTSRFHLLPNTVFSGFVALGTAAWLRSDVLSQRGLRAALVGLSLVLAAFASSGHAPHRGWTVLEDHGRNVLGMAEPRALILGNGDSRLFAMLYLQDAEGLRPDVAYVEPDMLGYPWYRDRLNARHPGLLPELEGKVDVPLVKLVARHYGQRPIYLVPRLLEDGELAASLPAAYPFGAVYMRLVGPLEELPPPELVEAELRRALASYTFGSRVVTEHQATATWESEAWDQHAITFSILADGYAATGDAASEARCRETARELSPWRFAAE